MGKEVARITLLVILSLSSLAWSGRVAESALSDTNGSLPPVRGAINFALRTGVVSQLTPGARPPIPSTVPPASAPEESRLASFELARAERRPVLQTGEVFSTKDYLFDYQGGAIMLSGDPPPNALFGVDDRLSIVVRRPDGTTATWERTFNTGCYENELIPPEDVTAVFQRGLNALTVTISDICGATVGTLGPVILSGTGLSAAEAPTPRSTASSPVIWLPLLLMALGAAWLIVAARRRLAGPGFQGAVVEGQQLPSKRSGVGPPVWRTAIVGVSRIEPGGRPRPEDEHRFEVGPGPVTIGSRGDCGIRLPAAPGLAPAHARVWLRAEGHLMLHHLAAAHITTIGGKELVWGSIDSGDEVALGPYLLRVGLRAEPGDPPS